jgi:hypothetical protein
MPPYRETFPKGSEVRIANREFLDDFRRAWKYHNKLQDEQLPYADKIATVNSVGYYHGGDVLYELEGVPGIWHEACLRQK